MNQLKNKKILVTGGAGFIGSHLVDALVNLSAKVTVLDNLQAGKTKNLQQSFSKIKFIKGDIRDKNTVAKVIKNQELIFHIAANASVPYSVENPEYDFTTNVVGTYNLLQAAIKFKTQKFIFASSAGVYGEPLYQPVDEKHPANPISPYGASKLAAEKLGISYYKSFGLNFVSVRIFNTFGPRLPRYAVYDFIKKLTKNPKELEILGDGKQERDFAYISDTIAALILVAKLNLKEDRIFNIAGNNQIKIKDLAKLIANTMGIKKTKFIFSGKSWAGDVKKTLGDISLIKKYGFKPKINLADGIKQTVLWFKKQSKAVFDDLDKK